MRKCNDCAKRGVYSTILGVSIVLSLLFSLKAGKVIVFLVLLVKLELFVNVWDDKIVSVETILM